MVGGSRHSDFLLDCRRGEGKGKTVFVGGKVKIKQEGMCAQCPRRAFPIGVIDTEKAIVFIERGAVDMDSFLVWGCGRHNQAA